MRVKDLRRYLRPGKIARVKWTDSGATDCIVLSQNDDGQIRLNTGFSGFFLDTRTVNGFDADQVIAIGRDIEIPTGI